ncbi:Cell wall synthesis protein kre9 precursor [Clarireedia jacksonii]
MRLSQAFLLTAPAHLAFAYPEFTVPAAGASVAADTAFTITWKDNGNSPSISDLASYQLWLYAGTNASPQPIYEIASAGTFSSSTPESTSATIPASKGGELTNAYFLCIIATATAGGTVTSYSNRFSISGMTGSFPTTFTVSGTDGPADVNSASSKTGTSTKTSSTSTSTSSTTTAASSADSGNIWAIPYISQTGLTKYAAMQPLPPTSISATNTAPQYPTSSVSLATTYLSPATVLQTLTQPQSATFASHANTVSLLC